MSRPYIILHLKSILTNRTIGVIGELAPFVRFLHKEVFLLNGNKRTIKVRVDRYYQT